MGAHRLDTIDKAAITRLLDVIGGDTEDLKELIEDFGEVAPELLQSMQNAVTSNDTDQLRIAAHSLKSNARDLGATRLAEESADLEKACSGGTVPDAAIRVEVIAQSVANAQKALHELSLEY